MCAGARSSAWPPPWGRARWPSGSSTSTSTPWPLALEGGASRPTFVDMSSLTIEHFAIPTTGRQARRLDDARARATDALAGRAVWWWADGGGHPEDPVCASDVVVLRERPEPDLMQALRELGAHVVWHIEQRPPEPARAVDAYVMTWI